MWSLLEIFCQAVVSAEHLSVAVSVFCVSRELKTPNLEDFLNILVSLHPTIANVVTHYLYYSFRPLKHARRGNPKTYT